MIHSMQPTWHDNLWDQNLDLGGKDIGIVKIVRNSSVSVWRKIGTSIRRSSKQMRKHYTMDVCRMWNSTLAKMTQQARLLWGYLICRPSKIGARKDKVP